jgi:hypothetical protein
VETPWAWRSKLVNKEDNSVAGQPQDCFKVGSNTWQQTVAPSPLITATTVVQCDILNHKSIRLAAGIADHVDYLAQSQAVAT